MHRLLIAVWAVAVVAGPVQAKTRALPVTLSWHPQNVTAHEPLLEPPRGDFTATTYVGPILVEGQAALLLQRLPSRVRRILASPVGVRPVFFTDGAGLGVYARLKH